VDGWRRRGEGTRCLGGGAGGGGGCTGVHEAVGGDGEAAMAMLRCGEEEPRWERMSRWILRERERETQEWMRMQQRIRYGVACATSVRLERMRRIRRSIYSITVYSLLWTSYSYYATPLAKYEQLNFIKRAKNILKRLKIQKKGSPDFPSHRGVVF